MTTSQTSHTSQMSRTATERPDGLAYALSHDLRARLRAAAGFLELARGELDQGADAMYFLDRASVAADLADRMVERLVRYLRTGPVGEIVVTDPAEVVRTTARRLDGLEVFVETLPEVLADPGLLAVAVAEILDNAARYRSEDHPPTVDVTAGSDESSVVLRFADNGFGLPVERVERAFELFRQVHRVGEAPGTGMGLPIARRCIEVQAGTLTMAPGPSGGTVVEIRLPAPQGASPTGDHLR